MNIKVSRFLSKNVGRVSPKLLFQLSYFHNRGRFPNLRHPKNLSEIIGSQVISGEILQYAPLADKVKMKTYLGSLGYGDNVPITYGVWDKFEHIDFASLPDAFILKTNHGCNCNIVVRDKSKFDFEAARTAITSSLNSTYGGAPEPHYALIEPKVFAEELLSENGILPIDYKFHCCNGEIRGVLLCIDRTADGEAQKMFYDENWNRLHILKHGESNSDYPKPAAFDDMKKIAKNIAKNFKQVRVDMYYINGKIYVGELTFTPQGGILRNYTYEGIKFLGQ